MDKNTKSPELSQIRAQLDEIDDKITELYVERMALCDAVAESKRNSGKKVYDNTRELAIVQRITNGRQKKDAEALTRLYREIFRISRRRQHAILSKNKSGGIREKINNALENKIEFKKDSSVACQGIRGSYSSISCEKLFSDPSVLYFEDFASVIKSVKSGLSRYGILPFENSIYGSVVEVYDMLANSDVHVVKAVKLPIKHALLAKKGTLFSDIREVYSHKQALGQCGNFFAENKNVRPVDFQNTAIAARSVAESDRNDIAAIASLDCAERFGLEVLRSDIQNSAVNFTVFYCVASDLEIYEGANKAAFMFNIANEQGTLAEVLGRFAASGINLTKIESRPIAGKDFEFMFYAEADIDGKLEELVSLFSELEDDLSFFRFIGIYPEL